VTLEDRRARDRAARHQLIISTARRLAEAEGWDAVTTRRLSTEIEYSQPVLYKHFSGMQDIAAAIAIEGFAELADVLAKARSGRIAPRSKLRRVVHAYIDFAEANPALYDAMFTRATTLRFADADTPPQLSAAFGQLRDAVSAVAPGQDVDTLSEVFWAGLHGLVTLARGGRLRAGHDSARVERLVDKFCGPTR
jgi:AcrR family transcriptional regulator